PDRHFAGDAGAERVQVTRAGGTVAICCTGRYNIFRLVYLLFVEVSMQRVWFILCLCLLVAVPAFAQDAPEEAALDVPDTDIMPWACPEGYEGQTLNVYNWSTYVAEDTISNFEALCGVTVVYDVYESNEALLSRLRQGNPGYDIIVPTDYMLEIMIEESIVQPIDLSRIPNFANVSEALVGTPFDPENQYSVPYQW